MATVIAKKPYLKVTTLYNFTPSKNLAAGFPTDDPTIKTLTISSFVADIKGLK